MASILSDSRRAIQKALAGCSGGRLVLQPTRVLLGYNARGSSAVDLWTDVHTNGTTAVIGPCKNLRFDNLGFGPVSIPIQVYVIKSKNTSFDATDIDDLVASILAALIKPSNYGTTDCPFSIVPRTITYTGLQFDTVDTDGIVCLSFVAEVPDPV